MTRTSGIEDGKIERLYLTHPDRVCGVIHVIVPGLGMNENDESFSMQRKPWDNLTEELGFEG